MFDTQHGKINPLLLSPEQFIKQITEIQSHVLAWVWIPGYKLGDKLSKLYGLISTKTSVLDQKIIIEITIPLSNREQFQLFNLIPIPTTLNGRSISIKPITNYLAITWDRGKYWLLSHEQLRGCKFR